MRILAYQGVSWISKAIRTFTRSRYSHIAVQLPNDSVIEAWHVGGVSHTQHPGANHTPGTVVDVFKVVRTHLDERLAEAFLRAQVAKPYDYWSVMAFLSRTRPSKGDRWFCSELAEEALRRGGAYILRGDPGTHSPRDLTLSPLLMHIDTIKTTKTNPKTPAISRRSARKMHTHTQQPTKKQAKKVTS
jgi:uncharacterized protein YycO